MLQWGSQIVWSDQSLESSLSEEDQLTSLQCLQL